MSGIHGEVLSIGVHGHALSPFPCSLGMVGRSCSVRAGGRVGRGDTFDARLGEIVEDYRFSYVAWEWQHLVGAGDSDADPAPEDNPGSGADTVRDYVSLVSRARSTQSALDRALAAGDED